MHQLLLWLVLVGAARACVTNGYGEEGAGGCALLYCNRGHEPDEPHERCTPCPKGRYSDTQDLAACKTCPNVPVHAEPTFFAETNAECLFVCHENAYGPYCQPLYSLLWPVVFLLMAIGALWVLVQKLKHGKKNR